MFSFVSFYVFVSCVELTYDEAWHDILEQHFNLNESGKLSATEVMEKLHLYS